MTQVSATTIGRVLIGELAAQGITDVVVAPGSRSAPLALAAAGAAGLRIHVRIDERTAGFLALGLARGSGRPAAVICSSGTAAAGFLAAVLEADAAGVPLLVLTADRPVELHDVGANQTMRQDGLYGAAVRWSHRVEASGPDAVGYLRSTVARAVAEARGYRGVAGPVHLNVPLREPLLDPADLTASADSADRAASADLADLADPAPRAVEGGHGWPADQPVGSVSWQGRRGVVVAGDGATPATPGSGALGREVLDVAAALGWPVLAEPTSGLRTGPPAIASGHWLAAVPDFVAAHVPEVVVVLGRPVLSRAVASLIGAAADAGAEVVVCDPQRRSFDPQRRAQRIIGASFPAVAAAALAAPRPVAGWLAAWTEADGVATAAVARATDGVGELATAAALVAAMPSPSTLVAASSLAIRHLNEVMGVRDGLRVLGNRGVSGIDGFTSTALGVALASEGPVAALAGDLSVIHDLTGLVIGPGEPIASLPVVVLSNDGGGIFDLLPYGTQVDPDTFRRLFTTPHGISLERVAAATGCGHRLAGSPASVPSLLHEAWSRPGITLVEVRSDTPTETARRASVLDAVREALRR